MNGGMCRTCAFRLIADGLADDYLWDGWDKDATTAFEWGARELGQN